MGSIEKYLCVKDNNYIFYFLSINAIDQSNVLLTGVQLHFQREKFLVIKNNLLLASISETKVNPAFPLYEAYSGD